MIGRVLPFLSRSISNPLAFKGIQKVSPKLGKFLETGIKEGLPLAAGMEFLRRQFSSESSDVDQTLRPDERSAQAEKKRYDSVGNKLGGLASLGLGVGVGKLISNYQEGEEEEEKNYNENMKNQQQQQKQGDLQAKRDEILSDKESDRAFKNKERLESQQFKKEMLEKRLESKNKNNPNSIDQVLSEIHDSSMGQYIRKSVQLGSDPMDIISTIMRKSPDRVHDIEKKTGDRFENVIDAYIKKIMGGSKVQRPEAAPQQQQQGGGMEQLMAVLQQVRDARQRRAGQ